MATTTQKLVVGGAVVVGVLLLISGRESHNAGEGTSESGGSRPCTVTVTADQLNVRSSPDSNASVVQTFTKGAVVSAERTIRDGFRELGPDRWAARDYLVPTPDSDCG